MLNRKEVYSYTCFYSKNKEKLLENFILIGLLYFYLRE